MPLTNKQPSIMTRRQLFRNSASAVLNPIALKDEKLLSSNVSYVNDMYVTPNADFFVPIGHEVPVVDVEENWRLSISGLVERPFTMSLEDLLAMQLVEQAVTVTNVKSRPDQFLMGQAVWRGVPFSALLEQAALGIDVAYAAFRSANGYSTYLPLELLKQAVLAVEMNGETLPSQQGYPVRLIAPGVYDYKMPKWLSHIAFTAVRPTGYFESRGWSVTGEVQTTSAIFSPRLREQVAGVVTLSGMGFAGNRDITHIELSIDDGEWMPVAFSPVERGNWTRWQIDWMPPASGDYVVRVRASDAVGFTQQSLAGAAVFPNGSSAIHSIVFRVVS